MDIERYPLNWPVGWKRTPSHSRSRGRFTNDGNAITIAVALRRLTGELRRMGALQDKIIVSSNLAVRRDGLPYSGAAQPADPGVACYWIDRIGKQRVMAADSYTRVEQNIAALAATIEAMRAIERHGGAVILERAFVGFEALPYAREEGKKHWRDVFGYVGPNALSSVERTYRYLRSAHHPDRGGSSDRFIEIEQAWKEAQQELSP